MIFGLVADKNLSKNSCVDLFYKDNYLIIFADLHIPPRNEDFISPEDRDKERTLGKGQILYHFIGHRGR